MAEYIDLYTLQSVTKDGIGSLFPDLIWVKAEISALSVKANGHCYLELSQNEGKNIIAKAKAMIWKTRYPMLSQYFSSVTDTSLKAGMEILAYVRVTYHEVFGLSLTIEDINPEYTLGQRERQRQETIDRLIYEKLIDLQKELTISSVPYRLAVISSASAAGYGDFRRHLLENEYQFTYCIDLYEAVMQGATAPASIRGALGRIIGSTQKYDAVMILRGGGSELDLDCFDDYALAAEIARFPVPVLTAIGHDRDIHVADMVAFASIKTPTALADFFIEKSLREDERILACQIRLRLAFMNRLNALESQLQYMEMKIESSDPRNVLNKGYSLILDSRGVRTVSAAKLRAGDRITLMMPDGDLDCTVDEVKMNKKTAYEKEII